VFCVDHSSPWRIVQRPLVFPRGDCKTRFMSHIFLRWTTMFFILLLLLPLHVYFAYMWILDGSLLTRKCFSRLKVVVESSPFQVVQTNCQVTINQQSKSKVICSLPSCHIDIGLVPTLDFYFFFSILWCWGSPHSKSVENWNFDLTCLLLLERNQLLDQYTWHFLLHHTARTKDEKWITTTDVWCDVSSLMRVWCWGWMSVY
jgi:hypothetical protein